MPAGKHLMGGAAYARHWRRVHKTLGLCRHCSEKAAQGFTSCRPHMLYQAEWKRRKRAAQKVAA